MPKPIPPTVTDKPPLPNAEETKLSPLEETLFKTWVTANGLGEDVKNPENHYDYRGFYKKSNGAMHSPATQDHFPDTFKQHGHRTFSIESMYSKGPHDGGIWLGDNKDVFFPQEHSIPSHEVGGESSMKPMASHTPLETSMLSRIK